MKTCTYPSHFLWQYRTQGLSMSMLSLGVGRLPLTSLSQIHHWLDRSWLKQCSVCSQLGLAASNPLSWGSGDRLANTVYTNGLQSGFGHLQTTALIHRHLKHHKVLLFRWNLYVSVTFLVTVSHSRPKHVHAVVGRRSPATHSLSQIHHWLDRSWLKQCSVCSQLGLAASNPLSWGSGDRLANTVYTNGLQSGFGHLQTTALIHRHLKHHKVLLFRWKPVRIRHISCDSIALKA